MGRSTDIAAAARRMAAIARLGEPDTEIHTDLLALLSVLDAVAAGRGDEGRVERMTIWAKALFGEVRYAPGTSADREQERIVGAAIALADAERAVALSRRDTSVVV